MEMKIVCNCRMKRLASFILLLLLLALDVNAQKKDIATAKENVKKNRNLEQAEQSMQKLLADSANRYNEKIWLILFESVSKQYDQGNMKLYLKQKYDTSALFNLTKKMFVILEAFDSIDATPDKKGKVSIDYRKKHSDFLDGYRANLFNGGRYYVNKQKYQEAYDFFDMYIDCAHQPLFNRFNYLETDAKMPEAAYWAVYCGYKTQDPKKTFHHTYLALKDTAHYHLMLQYLAETYKLEDDTARYVKTLKEGFEKFPTFQFFFPRLVQHYGDLGDWKMVLGLSEKALESDSANVSFLFTKSTALLNIGRNSECIAICDTLIARNDSLADPYYNAGLAWFNQAIEQDKTVKTSAKQRKKVQDLYKKALPYLERYRALAPEKKRQWALPLYTTYLNLNMGNEFDEIDRIIREMK